MHFDRLYRGNGDPWHATTSWQERAKRIAIDRAVGSGKYRCGLELGCGNGVSTLDLARRVRTLLAVDGSAEAISIARHRLSRVQNVEVFPAVLPDQFPSGTFDIIVASELLYYMPMEDVCLLLRKIRRALHPDGIFLTVNHIRKFSDSEITVAMLRPRIARIVGPSTRSIVGPAWRLDVHRMRHSISRCRPGRD